jgi:uncharacterized membrane protein YozB (DUF420 family)
MNQFLHQPGFLGTQANRAADITLVVMLLVAGLFTTGFILARRKHFQAHRWVQSGAVTLNLMMVLWMMVLPFRDFILRDKGGPRALSFYAITSIHALIGMAGVLFGVFVALRGNELVPKVLKFNNYKLFMRIAYGFYMGVTLLGLWVYLTWFVIIPNPPVY